MKMMPSVSLLVALGVGLPAALASEVTPVSEALTLLSGLQAKITRQGRDAKKVYIEFTGWCEDQARNLAFEIKTGKGEAADLQAKIEEQVAFLGSLNTKVEMLSGSIATDEADLKAATYIRSRETKDFAAEDADLTETIDMLERAIATLQREMQNGGASMLQLKNTNNVIDALAAMVEASAFSSADGTKLAALVQISQQSQEEEDEEEVGAPRAAVYTSQSGGIVSTLENLFDKAQAKLANLRESETKNMNNFQLLKQSLEDQLAIARKDMREAKMGIAESSEKKASAEGELVVTAKDLKADEKALEEVQHDCMIKAEDFEAETKSRAEELKALAEAVKIISESTGGAEEITYAQVSFLQVGRSRLAAVMDLGNVKAVRMVRDLSRKHNSPALSQLASRMSSAMALGDGTGDDPFAKVKALLTDMVNRLEDEAEAAATHKSYCDEHMANTQESKKEKDSEIGKLSTKIDQMSSRSAKLKMEVAHLQKALAQLAASQQELDNLRKKEQAIFAENKPELEQGLRGIQLALKTLRDYYAINDAAHDKEQGAVSGIVGLLEVVESDFTKGIAEMVAAEDGAQTAYEQETKDNEVEKTVKNQDVKFKTKEAAALDKALAETQSDRSVVQKELDAVLEFLKKLKESCVAKAETYEERKKQREEEITGLQEALDAIGGDAVLLQQTTKRTLRGPLPHAIA